jgi:hypothetical protein
MYQTILPNTKQSYRDSIDNDRDVGSVNRGGKNTQSADGGGTPRDVALRLLFQSSTRPVPPRPT